MKYHGFGNIKSCNKIKSIKMSPRKSAAKFDSNPFIPDVIQTIIEYLNCESKRKMRADNIKFIGLNTKMSNRIFFTINRVLECEVFGQVAQW